MKHVVAFLVAILTTAGFAAAGLITHGNFTSLDSPYSALPHAETPSSGTKVFWQDDDTWHRQCVNCKVENVTPSDKSIFKADCSSLAGKYYKMPGYWTVSGYASCSPGYCGLLATFDTCSVAVARTDGHPELDFYTSSVGNRDIYHWLHEAIDSYSDAIRMGLTIGHDECQSEPSNFGSYPTICWRLYKTPNS
ncbi:hypothetical protein PG993_008574 [Apiospora rasikravindrae]|uniref:Ecp2 effector protein-like domain-containing protein n=1 Tax=Apiospora rasikravindrae TaxID=990691 RepID=A0ABR1T0R3_9PEZI